MRRLASIVLFGLLASWASSAPTFAHTQSAWSPSQLDDPLSGNSRQCTPQRGRIRSYVCDASAQLAPRSARRIDDEIIRVHMAADRKYPRTTCNGVELDTGYLIEVAIVRRMATGRSQKAVHSFAQNLFHDWEVGSPKTCGNGILLFMSMDDHLFSFILGSNPRKLLSDSAMRRVVDVLTYYLKRDNLYQGVLNTVIKLGEELGKAGPRKYLGSDSNAPANLQQVARGKRRSWWFYIVLGIAALSALSLVFACCNGFGGKDAVRRKKLERAATKKLRLVKQEYEAAILPQYTPITCSVCQQSLTPGLAEATTAHEHRDADDTASLMQTGNGAEAFDPANLGPVRHLRCGHKFHDACLEKQGTTTGGTTVCPVCSDSSASASAPPTLRETRDRDLAFRVAHLKAEFPEVITDSVHQKLLAPPPQVRSPGSVSREYDDGRHRTGGPAWGALAGAAGVGALAGWGLSSLFSGWGGGGYDGWGNNRADGDDERSGFSGSWFGGGGGGYGSAVTGSWGNIGGDTAATTGRWGSGGGGGGWTGGWSGGWSGGSAVSGGWGGGGGGSGGGSSYTGGW